MKKYILLILLFPLLVSAQNFKTSFDQLVGVNEQWLHQKDVDGALKQTNAKPMSEQQLIQFHLQETEKLLRKRKLPSLSFLQQKQRLNNLNALHGYWIKGVFPVNDQHQNRQPYFIDKYNTYCAVGYLMQQRGGDAIARSINRTQNFSYLFDIRHSQLMQWVENSGLTLDELALIQPGYPGDWPTALIEFHYNNNGQDINEYLEVHESTAQLGGSPAFNKALLFDNQGNLYKTLLKTDMQSMISGPGYYYHFPITENFADAGTIVLMGYNFSGVLDTIEVTKYSDTAVDVRSYYGSTLVHNRHFSVGENENTSVGTTLTYCGFYDNPDWSLQSMVATSGFPNSCLILPVGLNNFSYSLVNKQVRLTWQTGAEAGTKSFTIERSNDGTNFHGIGTMQAMGTSNTQANYSFTDNKPHYINHYRIRQSDADGRQNYSKLLFVKVPQANPLETMQPIRNNNLQIAIHLEQADIASLYLYDFSGKIIKKFKPVSGVQMLVLNSISAGSYLLQLACKDGQVYNLQLLK